MWCCERVRRAVPARDWQAYIFSASHVALCARLTGETRACVDLCLPELLQSAFCAVTGFGLHRALGCIALCVRGCHVACERQRRENVRKTPSAYLMLAVSVHCAVPGRRLDRAFCWPWCVRKGSCACVSLLTSSSSSLLSSLELSDAKVYEL